MIGAHIIHIIHINYTNGKRSKRDTYWIHASKCAHNELKRLAGKSLRAKHRRFAYQIGESENRASYLSNFTAYRKTVIHAFVTHADGDVD